MSSLSPVYIFVKRPVFQAYAPIGSDESIKMKARGEAMNLSHAQL